MWETISDNSIRNIWACDKCDKEVAVGPDFYEEAGTPVCSDCDRDMKYEYTEIKE